MTGKSENFMEQNNPNPRRRGKAVKPAMVHVNIRIPEEVLAYFKGKPQYTLAMREVLTNHYKSNR